MAKTITYTCLTKTVALSDQYSGEHNVTEVVINFTDVDVDGWAKWINILLADGTGTSISLGTGLICSLTLGQEYLSVGGKILLEGYAISETAQKQFFGQFICYVQKILNISNNISDTPPTTIENIQTDISALQISLANLIYVGDMPPADPVEGQLWLDTSGN